jgi:DNA-directed RNA polymerase I, II, and III subunit RPABC2
MNDDNEFDNNDFIEDDLNNVTEDDIDITDISKNNVNFMSNKEVLNNQKIKEKKTFPFLTKYEKARIIGVRAQQISTGSPMMINPEGFNSALEVAEEELRQRKIPFIIRRVLPNGQVEDWKIEEFTSV